MKNQLYKAVQTGCGIALLAATLGTSAQAAQHSFGSGMIFFKGGSTPTYVVNVPNGNRSTDSTLVLEIQQTSATASTYTLGYSFGALTATSGAVVGLAFNNSDVNTVTVSSVNAVGGTQSFALSGTDGTQTNGAPALHGLWGSTNFTYFVPGSDSYTLPLFGQITLGSGASSAQCNYSMRGRLETNGNYSIVTNTNSFSASITEGSGFTGLTANTAGAAAQSFWFLNSATNTTYAAAAWTSFGTAALGVYDPLQSGSIALASSIFKVAYSNSTSAVSSANTAGLITNWNSTVAVWVNKINSCAGVYANRVALNNSGLILGGNNGLARIW